MYCLVDATSFYASAEKVFDASIRNKPVVVLTNNDGCICAVCPIAKKLGIPKFTPYYQVKSLLDKYDVVVRSSNYELYADLSERMMTVIARFCDNIHIYSIDEAFLYFDRYHNAITDWYAYGHQLRQAIWREVRLPVGVGFASTATLAKAANHAAKKLSGFDGVAVISEQAQATAILQRMKVNEVWGIGSRLSKKLAQQHIYSADDLAKQSAKHIRAQYSVVTERTVNELNGIACLSWCDVKEPKNEIFSTRSFGQKVTDPNTLQNALAYHASVVAKKLRQQASLVTKLVIFASNSPHNHSRQNIAPQSNAPQSITQQNKFSDQHYYKASIIYSFIVATDDSRHLVQAVANVMEKIYRQGIVFYRCGVGAIAVTSRQYQQHDLFLPTHNNAALMSCFDQINQRYGENTIAIASANKTQQWQMKRQFLSPQYTTNWRHIPKIIC